MKKRKFKIRVVVRDNGVSFDSRSQNIIDKMFKEIENSLEQRKDRVNRRIQGGPGFNKTLRTFSKTVYKKVKDRFIHNPIEWGVLSNSTIRMRHFLLKPEDFRLNIQRFWGEGVEFPIFRLNPGRIDKRIMKESYPILYQTGDLSRSITMGLKVKDTPYNKKFKTSIYSKFIREIYFRAKSPYAPTQFNGGMVTLFHLEKTLASGKGIIIPVPKAYVNEMINKSGILENQGFKLLKKVVEVPPRNPLYFDKEDIDLLGEFIDRLFIDFKTDLTDIYMNDTFSEKEFPKDKNEEFIF